MAKIYYSNQHNGIFNDPFFREMNLLFKDAFQTDTPFALFSENMKTSYPMDVILTPEFLIFEIPIIRGNIEDINITKSGGNLNIKYTRSKPETDQTDVKVLKRGIIRKDFDFVWKIPHGFDHNNLTSTYEDGLLSINVPRLKEPEPEKIPVISISK